MGKFKGCYFINASVEFGHPDSKINQVCARYKRQIIEMIKIYAQLDEATACQLSILKEGVITTAYTQQDKEASKKVIPILEQLFKL
ncbi:MULTISPECIES: hypothetical protein [Vibrio]|uniref:Uncharacterized protein n=1 Tax=Vibrio casei TaxID=673372 RepID=A0A368LH61_9VIBR|nr:MULTISPECIES: hypothetical protein [Vibrio]RCS70090.1 hypothetical protein CIK83_11505 [Vibrio casei]HBV76018.1 hypothetical protein [Vibrio sp.]